MAAPAVPIPVLVGGGVAIIGSVPEGVPVGIEALGDLGEVVEDGIPSALGGVVVVGGEAAAGGLRGGGEERGRPRGEGKGELLLGEGEGGSRYGSHA